MLEYTLSKTPESPDTKKQWSQALAAAARQAFKCRLTMVPFGVISMRLPMAGLFLITPFETSFEHIRSTDICLLDSTGTLVEGGANLTLPPETMFHLQSYSVRTDVQVIAHLHPPCASACALRGEPFDLVTETARREIKEVLRVQCADCISRFCGLCSCRTDIRQSYAGVNVLLLKEDGIVILGTSLENVLNLAELAEKTAQEGSRSSVELKR